MSKLIFDTHEWTKDYLIAHLKQYLSIVDISKSKVKTDLIGNWKVNTYFCLISNRIYVNQAFNYLKIGAFDPVPNYLISLSDLSPKLVAELSKIDKNDRDFVLKQAVCRIFEDINPRLYHNSISKVLKVKLVQ